VRSYLSSPRFQVGAKNSYAKNTIELWTRELTFMSRPDTLGDLSVNEIRPSLVQAYFDGLTSLPGKSGAAMGALKQLEKWAIVRELLPRQITLGVVFERPDGGHEPWTDAQIALACLHARPDLAQAIVLGTNTGQRRSDLVRLAPSDVEVVMGRAGINVIQTKTKKRVWVPILTELADAIETWPRRPGPWLRRALDDKPWTGKQLCCAWTYERDTNSALKPLSDAGLVLHGLRATACVNLVRAGCNTRQISDMIGMSEEMVARYTRFSEQKQNALAAVIRLEESRMRRRELTANVA
jgi:integrase